MSSPNPTIDVTTLATLKAGLTAGGVALPSDDALQDILTAVSQEMANYAKIVIPAQNLTWTGDGNGKGKLFLPLTPIISVTSVSVSGVSVPARTSFTGPGFAFSQYAVNVSGYCFDRGFQNVTIALRAGFETIPSDLVRACIDGSKFIVGLADVPAGAQSISSGDHSLSFASVKDQIAMCLTPDVTRRLDQYRSVVPVA